jgi:hypothetical protein
LQRKADQLEANIKKSTGLSAQERAALEFELVKTLAWRVDLLNPGGTGPSARASIWAVVESPAYRNLSPERKLALWQVVSTGLQTGKMGRDDLGRVAGGMWGLSQNKNVLAAYPELQNKNLGAGFMPSGGPDGLAALGLGVTALAGGGLQLGLGGGGAGLVAAANPWVLAALVVAAGAYMVLSSDIGQDAIRNIGGVLRASGTGAKIGAGGHISVGVTTTGSPSPKDPCNGTFREILENLDQSFIDEFEEIAKDYPEWMPSLDDQAKTLNKSELKTARDQFTGRGHHPHPLKFGGEPNPPNLVTTGETRTVKNATHTRVTNYWNKVRNELKKKGCP